MKTRHATSPVVTVLVWLAIGLIQHLVLGIYIEEIKAPVVLKDIPFDFEFTVGYERSDEQAELDGLVAIVSTVSNNVRIGQANFSSIFDEKNRRKTSFIIPEMMMADLGKIPVMLTVSLQSNVTQPRIETLGTKQPVFPSVNGTQDVWVIPGGLTLVPLIVTMLVAVASRNVLPALFCGVITASYFIYEFDLPTAFARTLDSIILTSLTDPNNQLVILFAMIMGGFVNMVNASGGSIGLANALATWANSGRSTQSVTLFFGLLIFFDDYASALILGATLRTVADKMSVSREKFCFLVDSGAAPIAALIPITSWTAFESALLQVEADKLIAQGIDLQALGYESSGFLGLLRMLKYAYYSIYLLFFQVFIIGTGREFGPMFLAERKALIYGVTDERYGIKKVEEADSLEPDGDDEHVKPPPRCRNAGIPILFFVIYSISAMVSLGAAAVPMHEELGVHNIFANVDSITVMYYGAVLASFLAALLYRVQSIPRGEAGANPSASVRFDPCCCCVRARKDRRPLMGCKKSIEAFVQGFTHLTSTIMVLVLAWSIGSAVDYIGAGRFLAMSLEGNVPPESLPVLIFLISCVVAFSTGSSWATMAVLYPICGPIAFQMSLGNAEIYYCSMAAILEGSVFGDHCSFISDTTIMSAMACRCPLTSHVVTQLPYAFFCAFVCLVCGYLPIGMQSLSVTATYIVGFAVTIVGVLILGARPNGKRLDLLNWIGVQVRTKCFRVDPESLAAITLMRLQVGEHIGNYASSERPKPKKRKARVADSSVVEEQPEPVKSLRRPSFESEEDLRPRQPEPVAPVTKNTQNVNPFEIDIEDLLGISANNGNHEELGSFRNGTEMTKI